MAVESDLLIDRQRLKRQLTFWRIAAVVLVLAAALAIIGFKAITTARDTDYDVVRALHIELLDPLLKD